MELMKILTEWIVERPEEMIGNHLVTRGFRKPVDGAWEWMRACYSNLERSGVKSRVIDIQQKVRTEIMSLSQISEGWWDLIVRQGPNR